MLARKYHPDHSGDAGSGKFREIQEAYEVLSDLGRRSRYNLLFEQGIVSDPVEFCTNIIHRIFEAHLPNPY